MTYHQLNAGGYHIVPQVELSFAKTSGGIRQVKITQNESRLLKGTNKVRNDQNRIE
jgi:hypothetical protein